MVRCALLGYVVALVVALVSSWGEALNRLTVRLYVLFRYSLPIAPGWASPEDYGLLLNVLLFVPLGVGVVMLTGWSWWRVTLVAALASTGFETIQLLLPREADPLDVLTNTLGATLGAVAVTALERRRGRPVL